MEWSPQDAMKAYLHTLHLSKIHNNEECSSLQASTRLMEPKCREFISALAAGNQAKLMVEISSSESITPLTIAMAVAAKQTKGQLICINLRGNQEDIEKREAQLRRYDLRDVVKFVHGNPCEVIIQYKNIDSAVMDCKLQEYEYWNLFKIIDVNPRGSIVVVNNVVNRREGLSISFAEVVKGRKGVESVSTLPIGQGMELIKFGLLPGQ